MKTLTFQINDFIEEDQCFHFACKKLPTEKPKFLHNHDYYEVFLILSGQIDHWTKTGTRRLATGSLVFIRPTDSHALQAVRGDDCEIINISFAEDVVEHLWMRYNTDLQEKFFWTPQTEPDIYLLEGPRFERAVNLLRELQISKNSLIVLEGFLLSLFTRVVDHIFLAPDSAPDWLLTASAAAHRPEVFRKGAAGFVDATLRSHEHVCRVSRKYLGVSPTEYVNRIRMEYAAQMLSNGDITITEIANQCGIEDMSYFYRVFQRHYSSTPRQYRLKNRKNPVQAS